MRKSVVLFFVLLLLGGPTAPLLAGDGEDACARGHRDAMTMAMESCHEAPCCAMVEPARDGNGAARRLERAFSVILDAPPVATSTPAIRRDAFTYGAAPPAPATSQTTPVLRR